MWRRFSFTLYQQPKALASWGTVYFARRVTSRPDQRECWLCSRPERRGQFRPRALYAFSSHSATTPSVAIVLSEEVKIVGYLLSLQALEHRHDDERGAQFASHISASACMSNISAIC